MNASNEPKACATNYWEGKRFVNKRLRSVCEVIALALAGDVLALPISATHHFSLYPQSIASIMDTAKPSRLLLLPRELTTMILEDLQDDHRALLSISLTCQSIYGMALPILNRRIVVHSNNKESYKAAVCQLPRVVQYVRELTIHLHIKGKPSRFGPAGTFDAYRTHYLQTLFPQSTPWISCRSSRSRDVDI